MGSSLKHPWQLDLRAVSWMDIDEPFGSFESRAAGTGAAGTGAAWTGAAGTHTASTASDGRLSIDDLFSPLVGVAQGAAAGAPSGRAGSAGGSSGRGEGSGRSGGSNKRGQWNSSLEEDLLDSDSDSDDYEDKPTKPGVRLWDSRALHPNGVQNWRDTPNCEAALKYVCPCGYVHACRMLVGL